MNYSHSIKMPIVKSLLYTLLILLFPIGAGVMITVFSLNSVYSALVQAAFFALASLCGFVILKKTQITFPEAGYRKPLKYSSRKLLWYIPIIVVEVLPLLYGWQKPITIPVILSTLLFMICVGVAEELYFRGLILQTLKTRSVHLAVLLSSVLFSVGHLSNLANGATLPDTLLQVLFAFLFGLVAAEIAITSKSILVISIWHFLHNTISTLTADGNTMSEAILMALQCTVLLGYGIYLWNFRNNEKII